MTDEEIASLFSPMFNSFFRNLALPETIAGERPQFLAHYTTLEVLERIVKTDEVWFSNPLFMNDLQEMRFGMVEGLRVFDQVCAGAFFEAACGSKERAAVMRSAFYHYFQKFDVEQALNVYVFCLSEHDPQQSRRKSWRVEPIIKTHVRLLLVVAFEANTISGPDHRLKRIAEGATGGNHAASRQG
jgi:hypothetical protein